MSVKFACQKCHQTLVAAEQKVGQSVQCPRCAASLVVPDPQAAAALLEMKRLAREKSAPPTIPSLPSTRPSSYRPTLPSTHPSTAKSKWRETPDAIPDVDQRPTRAEREHSSSRADNEQPSTRVESERSSARAENAAADSPALAEQAVDPRRVSIARWVLFAQAALIALVAGVAFLSGYVIGVGAPRPPAELSLAPQPAAVEITGRVRYGADRKQPAADSDAVIIVLPKGAQLAEKINSAGLRPQDPAPAENNAQARIIESLDGAYARADSAGEFRVSVRPGEYLVLAISRHARRPKGHHPPAEHLALIGQYFSPAADLLGHSKYDLAERKLPDAKPLEFDF
jgi:hypothetical protein